MDLRSHLTGLASVKTVERSVEENQKLQRALPRAPAEAIKSKIESMFRKRPLGS